MGVKGEGGDVSSDPPLIIRRCQSLHNTENSAPSHVEHPRSLTWWLSTHGFMCLYCTESKQQGGVNTFIIEVPALPSGPTQLHHSGINFKIKLFMQRSFYAFKNANSADETCHLFKTIRIIFLSLENTKVSIERRES